MRCVLLAIAVLAVWAGSAFAGGINLTWGDGCWVDNPQSLVTFACDTNLGAFPMTASFAPDFDLPMFIALDFEIDVQADTPTLPNWWQFCSVDGCRMGSLTGTADFNSAPGGCAYAWPGRSPSLTMDWFTAGACGVGINLAANRAKLRGSVASDGYPTIHRGTEYYAFRLNIDAQKSSGGSTCGGCNVPVTLVLNEIDLGGISVDRLTVPLANTCLRWQAAGTTPCSATPVRNMTWGAIKGFYR